MLFQYRRSAKIRGAKHWRATVRSFLHFSFPPRWHYDILRALDYCRAVNAPGDPRLAEAFDIVGSTRRADGRWSLQNSYKGKTYFELERLGAPSRWNTLRALRVLKWWEQGRRNVKGMKITDRSTMPP